MNHMKFESPDMTAQNIDRIAALFPNCITEMLDEERSTPEKKAYKRAVNFELLKQMLSPDVVDGDEAYEFTWVGKKAAIAFLPAVCCPLHWKYGRMRLLRCCGNTTAVTRRSSISAIRSSTTDS